MRAEYVYQGEEPSTHDREIIQYIWTWFEDQTKNNRYSMFSFVHELSKMGCRDIAKGDTQALARWADPDPVKAKQAEEE